MPTIAPLYRSRFRRPWYGIKLAPCHNAPGCNFYLLVLTARGHPMQRRIVKTLHEHWVRPMGTVDLASVNPDWLCLQ